MEQFDIFGGVSEPPEKPKPSKKFKTMQEQYGTYDSETCKTCGHATYTLYNKRYYKCELWHQSNCASTDIRLKDKACKKWIPGG